MPAPRLPSFIVIGAPKAATTWIADALRARDDVFMPGPEPHYFSREFARGDAWYGNWFACAEAGQIIGEKSADYLADPHAAKRIAQLLPDARLIAQLRNPVERAYSDYCMLFRRGQVNDDIERHLDRARTQQPRFLDDGLYASHLERFFDHFPGHRIRIILHDDIRRNPYSVMENVCDALDLPPALPADVMTRRSNDSAAALVPRAMRRLPRPIKNLVMPLRDRPAFETVRGLFARPIAYPPLRDTIRRKLYDYYRDDVERLSKLIGRDLGPWINPADLAA